MGFIKRLTTSWKMKILVKAYPNGEVNASKLPLKLLKAPSVPLVMKPHNERRMDWIRAAGIKHVIDVVKATGIDGVSPEPLCLSTVAISRHPKGSSGLTRHGRRQIECGTILLEQHCRRDCLSFLTLTLPDDAAHSENFSGFAKAKNRFTDLLGRKLKLAGLPDWYVGVVEPHPGRGEREGMLIPHYHICFKGRLPGRAWILSPEWLKTTWYKCMVNEGLCSVGGNHSACANVQRVKKSVANYMGKYMAKTRLSTKQETPENLAKTHPGTWHLISRSLLKLIKQSTKHRSGTEAETILDFLAIEDNPWVLYRGKIEITAENGTIFWVGSYAKVTQECLKYL